MIKYFTLLLFISCSTQDSVKSITVAQLQELLQKQQIQLIDIRTPKEFKEGNINSAKNINFFDENFIKIFENEVDKSKPVYIYCKSGNRSLKAYSQLSLEGFDVLHLEGGYLLWKPKN